MNMFNVTDFGDYVIIVVNDTTHNSKYCPSFGYIVSEKYAQKLCNDLNSQYSNSLKKYNCRYDYIQISTLV